MVVGRGGPVGDRWPGVPGRRNRQQRTFPPSARREPGNHDGDGGATTTRRGQSQVPCLAWIRTARHHGRRPPCRAVRKTDDQDPPEDAPAPPTTAPDAPEALTTREDGPDTLSSHPHVALSPGPTPRGSVVPQPARRGLSSRESVPGRQVRHGFVGRTRPSRAQALHMRARGYPPSASRVRSLHAWARQWSHGSSTRATQIMRCLRNLALSTVRLAGYAGDTSTLRYHARHPQRLLQPLRIPYQIGHNANLQRACPRERRWRLRHQEVLLRTIMKMEP